MQLREMFDRRKAVHHLEVPALIARGAADAVNADQRARISRRIDKQFAGIGDGCAFEAVEERFVWSATEAETGGEGRESAFERGQRRRVLGDSHLYADVPAKLSRDDGETDH